MSELSRLFCVAGFSGSSLVLEASQGNCAEVKKILGTGASDVVAAIDDALCIAALRGHADVVALMLKAGADAHAMNDEPLRFATMKGHTGVIEILRAWIDRKKTQPGSSKLYDPAL